MVTIRRSVAPVVALVLLLAACTGDGDGDGGDGTGGSGPTRSTGVVGPTPVLSGSASSGTFEYVNTGLRVVMEIDGTAGTMEVDNRTGRALPRPAFYILGATDGHRVDGQVADAVPVPPGERATFDISFEGIEVGDIGAIALLFGQDNYGLFVRTG
jgi:hypothetical protein